MEDFAGTQYWTGRVPTQQLARKMVTIGVAKVAWTDGRTVIYLRSAHSEKSYSLPQTPERGCSGHMRGDSNKQDRHARAARIPGGNRIGVALLLDIRIHAMELHRRTDG